MLCLMAEGVWQHQKSTSNRCFFVYMDGLHLLLQVRLMHSDTINGKHTANFNPIPPNLSLAGKPPVILGKLRHFGELSLNYLQEIQLFPSGV